MVFALTAGELLPLDFGVERPATFGRLTEADGVHTGRSVQLTSFRSTARHGGALIDHIHRSMIQVGSEKRLLLRFRPLRERLCQVHLEC